MVQIGNEINNGMMWPFGKLWIDGRHCRLARINLEHMLKSGIKGVKDARDKVLIFLF